MTSLRNVAIIAHVDHGKTTLLDRLLQQSGSLSRQTQDVERVMDSNDLERERGITILAKNTAITWKDCRINIVDTPGHADFGGEVERVLSMVDSVLLVVDALDGPMPQTRFVTQKAFDAGLNPIVVINKIDRPGARPDWVIDQVFDLFDRLGASEEQLDFPVIYASALEGYAMLHPEDARENMHSLLDLIVERVPEPQVDPEAPFCMQISSLDYSSYVGTIGIGLVHAGRIAPNTPVVVVNKEGQHKNGRLLQVLGHQGLARVEMKEAHAGDIIAITGIEGLNISDTLCDKNHVRALPPLKVDEPAVWVNLLVNDSPFAGRDGKFVTSRQLRARLEKELLHNVALRVEDTEDSDRFQVAGRGELHLSILLETMRREGYEMAVSQPSVVFKEEEGVRLEPIEQLTLDIDEKHQGGVMEALGPRRAELKNMQASMAGRMRLDFEVPTRGLLGFHTLFQTLTSGSGIMTHVFERYAPVQAFDTLGRAQGALISNAKGKATGYALWNLQPRGRLLIGPQTEVYEGMIVGWHSRDNDLVVNVTKEKQLTNMRASGTDENISLTPPIQISLEYALELINSDELVEITPNHIRLRKRHLKEHERRRQGRED